MQLEGATERLRRKLLNGEFAPGEKLREIDVAEVLEASRTIARLAMSALEHEGLLLREPNRGSRLRAFTVAEIADAIEVRGELEAMGARLTAERGIAEASRRAFAEALARGEALLAEGVNSDEARKRWTAMNADFHRVLAAASGNRAISVAIEQMLPLPLVAPEALIFDLSNHALNERQLERSHADHVAIVDAIETGKGHRAEGLVREHAFRSAQNKRENLSDPRTLERARNLPGGKLIVP